MLFEVDRSGGIVKILLQDGRHEEQLVGSVTLIFLKSTMNLSGKKGMSNVHGLIYGDRQIIVSGVS